MKIPEEELQNKIGRGEFPGKAQDPEINAYQRVFRVLSQEQGNDLPDHFADRVMEKVKARSKSPVLNDIYLLLIGQVGITFILALALFLAGVIFDIGFLTGLARHWEIILSGAAIFIIINYLERKFVRVLF